MIGVGTRLRDGIVGLVVILPPHSKGLIMSLKKGDYERVRIMKLRFKLRRMKTPFESVDAGEFVGFVRGLNKLTSCKVLATIEDKTTAEHFIIDVRPLRTTEKWVNFAKRQAESYGVIVEVIDEEGD